MFIKKFPDGIRCFKILIGFTDEELRQVLIATGPGVAAASNFIQNNIGTINALHVDVFLNARAVFRFGVGYYPDLRVQ